LNDRLQHNSGQEPSHCGCRKAVLHHTALFQDKPISGFVQAFMACPAAGWGAVDRRWEAGQTPVLSRKIGQQKGQPVD